MKNLNIFMCLLLISCTSSAQTSLEFSQGIWKEEIEGFQSYVFVENNYWYSITVVDGNIDISRDWFGFYDDFEISNLHPKKLQSDGQYLVFLTYRKSIEDYDKSIERRYYDFYEYDLDRNYLIYYGNDPVALNRIDSLPADVLKIFKEEKDKLDSIKFP